MVAPVPVPCASSRSGKEYSRLKVAALPTKCTGSPVQPWRLAMIMITAITSSRAKITPTTHHGMISRQPRPSRVAMM